MEIRPEDIEPPLSQHRYGRRMFAVHKNMHSAGFIGVSEAVTVRHQRSLLEFLLEKQRVRSLSALRPLPPAREAPKPRQVSESPEAMPLPRVKSANIIQSLPTKAVQVSLPSPVKVKEPFAVALSHRNERKVQPEAISLEAMQKRLMAGPRFTKKNPRLDVYNPITGLKNEAAYRTVRKHTRRGAVAGS